MPKDGRGEEQQVGPHGDRDVIWLAQDETYVYWMDVGKIIRLEKATDTVAELPMGISFGMDIMVDDAAIYTVNSGCQRLSVTPKMDGKERQVELTTVEPGGGETTLAVDSSGVYCGSGASGRVLGYDKTSGDVVGLFAVSKEDVTVEAVAVHKEYVYWLTGHTALPVTDEQQLWRTRKDGTGQPEILADPEGNVVKELLVDEKQGTLYWTSGTLYTYDPDEQTVEVITETIGKRGGPVADEQYLYWTEWDGIVRRKK